MRQTKVTPKHQTTVPKEVRAFLGLAAGEEVEWHIVRGMVVVDTVRKVKDPVKFLTSQARLDLDMVALVREAREAL
jgi:AbrB family looped-hinge helix DNA binding protein